MLKRSWLLALLLIMACPKISNSFESRVLSGNWIYGEIPHYNNDLLIAVIKFDQTNNAPLGIQWRSWSNEYVVAITDPFWLEATMLVNATFASGKQYEITFMLDVSSGVGSNQFRTPATFAAHLPFIVDLQNESWVTLEHGGRSYRYDLTGGYNAINKLKQRANGL